MTADGPAPRGLERGYVLGRYALYDPIASGGMATVHFGRLLGPAGFSRTVAIKRLHPHLSTEPEFVAMLLDEARLAARVRHPNVVATLDVVTVSTEVFLVMEYVEGESIGQLLRADGDAPRSVPPEIACTIAAGLLRGLHGAHEARGERGEALEIVHRDVSPQNVLVGIDGVPRIVDFGVAKASIRLQTTQEGKVKGKLAYMAPEQLRGLPVTRKVDVYAASVVLWEMLAGRRLFKADNEGNLVEQVLTGHVHPPSRFAPSVPAALDDLVLRGLSTDPSKRFDTALGMAAAVEAAVALASAPAVGAWVSERASAALAKRAERIAEIESEPSRSPPASPAAIAAAAADPTLVDRAPALAAPAAAEVDSKIATATDAGPRVSAKRSWGARAALALVSIALGGGAVFVFASRGPTPPPATLGAGALSGVTPSTATTATGAAPSASEEATSTSRAAVAVPSVSTPAPTAKPSSLDGKRGPHAPSHRAGCNPPYTRDAAGRVQWKVECL